MGLGSRSFYCADDEHTYELACKQDRDELCRHGCHPISSVEAYKHYHDNGGFIKVPWHQFPSFLEHYVADHQYHQMTIWEYCDDIK